MAVDQRISTLIQRTPNGQEYFEVIIPPFTPGTNRKVLLSDLAAIFSGGGTFSENEVPSGLVNSSNVAFTLANTPVAGSVKLYQNGIRLKAAGVDYSISGTTITFITAPTTGDLLLTDYRI